MTYQIINKVLKFLILFFAIFLLILVLELKTSDCDKCSFEYNNSTIGANKFMSYYADECFHQEELNFTLNLPNLPN